MRRLGTQGGIFITKAESDVGEKVFSYRFGFYGKGSRLLRQMAGGFIVFFFFFCLLMFWDGVFCRIMRERLVVDFVLLKKRVFIVFMVMWTL